ncbi:MAG: twin-arginine translocase TatA/TatE family subunit [Alphaproteobacteria bacterium]|nr:twin-arginine translocase TatA/TatE family subunit [Alphaproteobacteria bacterium]
MGMGSIWHWLVVLLIVLVLFGAGKIPKLMGDLAKGVKAFKTGLKDEDEKVADASGQPPTTPAPGAAAQPAPAAPQASVQAQAAQPAGQTVRN